MGLLILQILVIGITAYVSINSLKKDLRSRTEKTKLEAKNNRLAIIIISVISSAISVWSYLESNIDKRILNRNVASIRHDDSLTRIDNSVIREQFVKISKENVALINTIDKNSINQSNLITSSQNKSSKQLVEAASDLRNQINGSNDLPFLSFGNYADKRMLAIISNESSSPIYNIQIAINNFEKFEQCKFIPYNLKYIFVNDSCRQINDVHYGLFPVIQANSSQTFEIPNNTIPQHGKVIVEIVFKGKNYIIEGEYLTDNYILYQATRMMELSLNYENILTYKTVKSSKVAHDLKKVDWEKDFPNRYISNILVGK
ncbi:MAG: hypothetical protein V5804_03765 [Mucilaginibacter sp.]|uniref:hypothetical protein n=1 Tax=Mucilaginibacter sp. TaxID=1882438 RepID=UPI0034E507AC